MSNHNSMENGNYIALDLATFKKSSKRICNILAQYLIDTKQVTYPHIPVNKAQELLAQSFGFRNYDAIQKYFNKQGSLPTNKSSRAVFLPEYSAQEIIELFSFFLEHTTKEGGKEWKAQALSLISVVARMLKYMQEQELILLDIDVFEEYLKLDNLAQTYQKARYLPNDIRGDLRAYLMSLPDYDLSNEQPSQKVVDSHNLLFSNLYPVISKLKQIQNFDPIIINPRWYHAVYSQNPGNTTSDKKKFTVRLNEQNLEDIAQHISHNEWNYLFKPLSKKMGDTVHFTNHHNISVEFLGIELINPIEQDSCTEDTWLKDQLFEEVLLSFIRNKNFKTYYLSDLLFYSFKIMNHQKRNLFNNFLANIIQNYSSIVQYSNRLELLDK